MGVVIDASSLAAWLLPDKQGAALDGILQQRERLFAPRLLWSELRNTLIVQEIRGRIAPSAADRALRMVESLDLAFDEAAHSRQVMDLARRHGITVYDAMYAELASRLGMPLLSEDKALRRAALSEGIAVL
jgi:predicted nucleic acid-binding protein